FHCYNRVIDAGGNLLFASRQAPKALPWILPDLQSRILSALVLLLKPLNDEQMAQALQLRAAQRGMSISDEVCNYILTHMSREPKSLFDFFDLLDTTSLSAQRKITIPFVKEVMQTNAE
ncbi:MAG TPA: DnaA regulatory inactivator Hda, partial [Gammaproteobacteria bacterium]|nr:DnaA regulatory inactivator Hda [Gammaproteobacteria bacterium]